VTPRSKAWVYGRSVAEIAGSNPAGGMDGLSCEFCALSDRGHYVGPITCPEQSYRVVLSECDREASIMRRPCPTRGSCDLKKGPNW